MPYIPTSIRPKIDPSVEALAQAINASSKESSEEFDGAGNINYAITRLLVRLMGLRFGKKYSTIAMYSGVLDNVKDEFYRRFAAQYEDRKKSANGDVFQEVL